MDSLKQSLNRQLSRPLYKHRVYQSKFKWHASSSNNTAGSNPAVEAFPCTILEASAGSTETVISIEAKDCQALIRQLKAKHIQIVLQWIPGHSQIAGNEYADTLAKKGAKITQKHIREKSYHSIKLHFKQVFQSAYRQELGAKLFKKPCKQELAKIPDWPIRRAVAEFRLCVGHDCLGTHLHRTGIRPVPYCMLCILHETMDRNHLGRCTALSSRTECERYWEARTKMMEY